MPKPIHGNGAGHDTNVPAFKDPASRLGSPVAGLCGGASSQGGAPGLPQGLCGGWGGWPSQGGASGWPHGGLSSGQVKVKVYVSEQPSPVSTCGVTGGGGGPWTRHPQSGSSLASAHVLCYSSPSRHPGKSCVSACILPLSAPF